MLSLLIRYAAYAFAAYAALVALVVAGFLWTESRQNYDSGVRGEAEEKADMGKASRPNAPRFLNSQGKMDSGG